MTKEQFEQYLVSRGYQKNRWGHYIRPNIPQVRFKLSKLSVRLEFSSRGSSGKLNWFRVKGGYYSNLFITPENNLRGMSHNALGFPPKGVSHGE